ncbi:hypothetical protein [Bacillus sp. SJS]|uniref:hypothetical protein n=1 Tax=Bacillus sp. SJS TaxID=1423321 RepID=UPI0012E9041D|nr:hypothetical protein [Bacillus sp. SJS]
MDSNWVSLIVILVIGFMLRKYLKFNRVYKVGYMYKHFGEKLEVSYKKYTGVDYYHFVFKKGKKMMIVYDVVVEEGELTIEWSERKRMIWKETFKESSQGTFSSEAGSSLHTINLKGEKTRGGCRIEFR